MSEKSSVSFLKQKPIDLVKQFICYIGGLLILTVGLNLSKLSGLGISPVSSIPRACEIIWGLTLGTTSMIVYAVLVLLQFILLRKRFRVINILGIVVTFLFSWMIDLTGSDPRAFGHLMAAVPVAGTYPMKLVYLVVSIFLIALGVFLYTSAHWIPMPAEGLAEALSTVTGKAFGDCKTMLDCTLIAIALILQLVFLGGFDSFKDPSTTVVREGTIISAVCVGQVVKFFNRKLGQKLQGLLHSKK